MRASAPPPLAVRSCGALGIAGAMHPRTDSARSRAANESRQFCLSHAACTSTSTSVRAALPTRLHACGHVACRMRERAPPRARRPPVLPRDHRTPMAAEATIGVAPRPRDPRRSPISVIPTIEPMQRFNSETRAMARRKQLSYQASVPRRLPNLNSCLLVLAGHCHNCV